MEFLGRTCGTAEEHSRKLLKKAVQQGRRRVETGGVALLTHPPQAAKTACFPLGYVEDFGESRTLLAGFFSSLLRREELFGIGGRKPAESSSVASAV